MCPENIKGNQKRKVQIGKSQNEGSCKQVKSSVTIIITKLVHKFEVQSMKWEYLFAFCVFEFSIEK
jgi:hypothetical protein